MQHGAVHGVIVILGRYTVSPECVPVRIFASIWRIPRFRTESLVPLRSPVEGLRLPIYKSIIGACFFKVNVCGGVPEGVILLMNSV